MRDKLIAAENTLHNTFSIEIRLSILWFIIVFQHVTVSCLVLQGVPLLPEIRFVLSGRICQYPEWDAQSPDIRLRAGVKVGECSLRFIHPSDVLFLFSFIKSRYL